MGSLSQVPSSLQPPWYFLVPWPPFLRLLMESWGFSYPALKHTSYDYSPSGPSRGGSRRKKKVLGGHSSLLGPQLLHLERKIPLPRSFQSFHVLLLIPLLSLLRVSSWTWGSQEWGEEKNKRSLNHNRRASLRAFPVYSLVPTSEF